MAYVGRYRDVCLPDAIRFQEQFCSGGRYYRNIIDTTDTGPVSSSIGIEISKAAVSILRPHP